MNASAETKMTGENGGTDFAIRNSKLHIRLVWVFRLTTMLLLAVVNVEAFLLGQRFVSREEYMKTDARLNIGLEDLKTTLSGLQRELAVRNANTVDLEQSRRLDDHETRLRDLERNKP